MNPLNPFYGGWDFAAGIGGNDGGGFGGWNPGQSPGDHNDRPDPNDPWEFLLRFIRKFGIPLAFGLVLGVVALCGRRDSKYSFLQNLQNTACTVESKIVNQTEKIVNQTELGNFLEEIKQKRIARTGVADESDLWNDFWEILYYYTNLPKSPRYGTFYAGERLGFVFEKDLFFENNDLKTSRYWKKNARFRSTFDPRTVWTCKDSFSQGILPLKIKCTRPLPIPPYPDNWPKKRRYPVRIVQHDPWIDFYTF